MHHSVVHCQLDVLGSAQSSAATDRSSRRVVSPLKASSGRTPLKFLRRGSSTSDTPPQQSPPGERNGKTVRVWHCVIFVFFKRLVFSVCVCNSRCFLAYLVHFSFRWHIVSMLNVVVVASNLLLWQNVKTVLKFPLALPILHFAQ